MSGFEALSLVCSIMQVISFSKELITTCKDIYEGRATADGQLQENTASIKELLDDMNQSSGSVPQHTQDEKDLHAIRQKCSSAAQDLQTELQRLTQHHKPGSVVKAFVGGIKSFTRERKIKQLSTRFRQYQETLETHILVHLCTKADALQFQQQGKFTELSTTMQNFISQIAAGHTEMANLLSHDGIKTRQQVQQSETHVKDSINAIYVDANMEAKRNRLLWSLKFESMNARRTEIKIANEATYVSFFKSLEFKTEPISRSAAAAWAGFVNWLQSDEQTFWIQGKPGAGKSTLIKFLLQHEQTHKALEKWNHDSLIVSHFFCKPGEILQKNLRGLLCSLNHQLLSSEPNLIDQMLPQFKFSRENDSVRDWEISDLITIFTFILKSYNKPIFFLIDGVDEATNPEEILEFLTSSFTLRNTKWCVSSRGEERFQQAFSKYNGFKLNEYTRDEMLSFAWKEIEYTLKSIQGYENMYTELFLWELQQSLVDKAEGVFLWLVLVLESIKRGLRHNDKTDVILSRLRKLPTGLEELYADMWDRLGEDKDIYQREAAHYFNLLIINRTLLEEFNERYEKQSRPLEWPLTPFQIMLSQDERLQQDLLNKSYKLQLSDLEKRCSGITRSISIKTAGLLIIQEKSDSWDSLRVRNEYLQLEKHTTSKIEFVHRTLFDFLKDTESGKAILAQAQADRVYVQLATVLLCQLRIMIVGKPELLWEDYIVSFIERGVFRYFLWLVNQAQRHNSYSKESIFDTLLLPFETLFEAHLIPWDHRPKPHPRPCFEILLLNDPAFEPFMKERLERKGASYATRVLREYMFVEDAKFVRPHNSCVDVVEFLLRLGADINSTDACFYESRGGIVENGQFIGWFIYESALSAIIKRLCSKPENKLSFKPGTPSCELLRYFVAFLERSPNLNTHTSFLLATPASSNIAFTEEDRGWGMNLLLSVAAGKKNFGGTFGKTYYPAAVIISEVNLKYLVGHFLKRASSKDKATNALLTRAQQLVQLPVGSTFSDQL